jgi:hypothetical protein
MLRPKDDRVDYGDNLRPPQGFELSCALATSFTLDLETLMCLPIALCFDNTLEGKLEGEKLALLEAISQLSGRLKVFFQQGNIKIPLQFNRLFTLLEDCLVPMVPTTEFSSFHPKIWLLRFTGPNNEVRYRLLVLSRNMTFDRSWDVAVTLEGELRSSRQTESKGLLQLLDELKPSAENFSGFKHFEKELPKIEWKKPPGFYGLKTLVGGKQTVPLDFGRDTTSILVISPFLHPKALDSLQKRGAEHFLLSRSEELNRIGKDALKDWDCYSLSDKIVSGEDDLEGAREQNLHAKLILVQNGATSHWHLGSANATVAALGDEENKPRNTEFMVRLTGHREELTPQNILQELKGTKEKPSGIFVEHEFSGITDTEESPADIKRRRLLEHELINAPWKITATESDDCTYCCEVSCGGQVNVPDGFNVEVGLLTTGVYQVLQTSMRWPGLAQTHVSAFLPLRVMVDGDAKPALQLMVKARLDIKGGDNRSQKIMNELIDSKEKFMAYVRLLLMPDTEKSEWFGLDLTRKGTAHNESLDRLLDGPVFELLLCSAARQPEQLDRIELLISRLQQNKTTIPEEFSQLWAHFKKHKQGKRR